MTFEVVDKTGAVLGAFPSAIAAAAWAHRNLPGGQDSSGDFEEPNGWDIRLAGRA